VAVFSGGLDASQIQTIMSGNYSAFGGPVPEPGSTVLAMLCVAGVTSIRRRR
jgi:hypothetical protein